MRVNSKGATVVHYEGDGADTQESKADIMFSNSSDLAASPQGVHKESGRKQGSLGVLYSISSFMVYNSTSTLHSSSILTQLLLSSLLESCFKV
jgi:hypothetical protein